MQRASKGGHFDASMRFTIKNAFILCELHASLFTIRQIGTRKNIKFLGIIVDSA